MSPKTGAASGRGVYYREPSTRFPPSASHTAYTAILSLAPSGTGGGELAFQGSEPVPEPGVALLSTTRLLEWLQQVVVRDGRRFGACGFYIERM